MRNGSVQISHRSNRVADSSEITYTRVCVYWNTWFFLSNESGQSVICNLCGLPTFPMW